MSALDWLAFALFLFCWLMIEPILARTPFRGKGMAADMEIVRAGWMQSLLRRDTFLVDAQMIGHTINSASFFGSANLLIIVGVGGSLFAKTDLSEPFRSAVPFVSDDPAWLFQLKVLLVLATLLRGLSEFIWAVRQLNYCLAAVGASPVRDTTQNEAWAHALSLVVNPAMRSFSKGVRSYYFSLAAALWLFGPVPLIVGSLLSTLLLLFRQSRSDTARGIREVRKLLEQEKAQ